MASRPIAPAASATSIGSADRTSFSGIRILLGVLLLVVGFLFRDSFDPNLATFANDGPLGVVYANCNRLPAAWSGVWADLNWVGLNGGSTPFDLTSFLAWALGPLGFIKFYPGITIVA